MRSRGARADFRGLKPHDHVCCTFEGRGQFEVLTAAFLDEGLAAGERGLVVRGKGAALTDPTLQRHRSEGRLGVFELSPVDDVFRATEVERWLGAVTIAVAEARHHGCSGLRVVVDHTVLLADPDDSGAWLAWESGLDRLLDTEPVTGLCALDRGVLGPTAAEDLALVHPVGIGSVPVPPFRLFVDQGVVVIEGEVDSFSAGHLRRVLTPISSGTRVVFDVSGTGFMNHAALLTLYELTGRGVEVSIRGAEPIVRHMAGLLEVPAEVFCDA